MTDQVAIKSGQKPLRENYSQLALFGASSILLYVSIIFSFISAFPLILAVQTFGRVKGYSLMFASWSLVMLFSFFGLRDISLAWFYSGMILCGVIISETLLRDIKPMKAVIKGGTAIVLLCSVLAGGLLFQSEKPLKTLVVEKIELSSKLIEQQKEAFKQSSNSEGTLEALALLDQPELFADYLIENMPVYFVMMIFFFLWANSFIALVFRRLLLRQNFSFSEESLANFKVNEYFIWLVIASLVLAIWGDSLGERWPALVGLFSLKILGVFYFFQGFGIYWAFLNYAKIRGVFRLILVAFTVMSAAQVLALVGLFDMFINIRRFLVKK